MKRWYLCEIIGDGSDEDSFRPASADVAPGANWGAVDGRADATIGGGWMVVRVDVDAAQHAALGADARIQYIPLEENGTGRVLDLDDRITLIRGSVRSQIAAELEARHIPTDDFDATTTVRQLLRRVMRRALLRQLLGGDDYIGLLDSTVGDIAAAKRQRVATRLESLGYDLTGITLATTVRAALRMLAAQGVALNRTMVD